MSNFIRKLLPGLPTKMTVLQIIFEVIGGLTVFAVAWAWLVLLWAVIGE